MRMASGGPGDVAVIEKHPGPTPLLLTGVAGCQEPRIAVSYEVLECLPAMKDAPSLVALSRILDASHPSIRLSIRLSGIADVR